MDFKIKNLKRPSTNIQYVRSYDTPSDAYKSNHCFKFIFRYKTSFIAAIFSIVLLICFIIMMIYVALQSELAPNHSESLIIEEKAPISSQILLSFDSKKKDAVIKLSTDEKLIWPDLSTSRNVFETNRLKRQIPQNVPDCISRHDECKIILDSVRGITKSMHEKLDRLYSTLTNQAILKESDPKEAKFRKIMECLQCKNSINYKDDEYGDIDPYSSDITRNVNDQISDLLPFLEDHTYENDEANREEDCGESIEKVTTQRPFQKYGRPDLKIDATSPDVATIRNLDPFVEPKQKIFHYKPIDISNDVLCEESQVSQKMDVTPIILPPAEISQTRQQIQFTPQNSWPYIPVCYYELPSLNFYQSAQNSEAPLFASYTSSQGNNFGTLNQPIKLIYSNDQRQKFTSLNLQPQFFQPNSFSTSQSLQTPPDTQFQSPSAISEFSKVPVIISNQQAFSQQGQQNIPVCSYIFLPSNYQQQIFPTQNWANSQFTNKPRESKTPTKEFLYTTPQPNQFQNKKNGEIFIPNQQQQYEQQQQQQSLSQIPFEFQHQASKNRNETIVNESLQKHQRNRTTELSNKFGSTVEQFYNIPGQCNGFMCNPPYKKCIESNQRCDGQVDCMSAEDEIGCPNSGYYTRFHNIRSNLPITNIEGRTMSTISTFEEDRKQTTMSTFEDERKQSTISRFEEKQNLNSSSISILDLVRRNNITSNATQIDDEYGKTALPKGRSERTTIFADHTTMAPNNLATESSFETETTTSVIIPEIPHQFICKRIMQTIPLEKQCNNILDCEDASDEQDCKCKDYLRLSNPSSICDGHVDCPDESDEKECALCKENEYYCYRSGGCIPKRKRCDQIMDCKLNEDELDCFALTDGRQINFDLDKRPYLNLDGVLTRYDNGVWYPSCFKSEFRNETKRIGAGQKICEYLGFRNVESADEILVQPSKLVERSTLTDISVNKNHSLYLKSSKTEVNTTCHGLYIRCKPILDRKLNVHIKINPKSKKRSYIWPWEASIYVDGIYHCSAVLLDNNLLLSSSKCTEDVDVHKNYTAALMGVAYTKFPYKSTYEQLSPVVNIMSLHHSDASLFKLKNNINMTRYIQPLYLTKRIFPASRDDICIAIGVNLHNQRQMKFLQPILNSCPKCHRCYIEKSGTSLCPSSNSTLTWSGYVVCLSSGGWYPAAVFQDKDENCGFSTKQILNSIEYIHAHLYQAIEEIVEPFVEPYCEGIRCSLGQCVPWENVCDGVRDCRDGVDENQEQCQKLKQRCENGFSECKCSKTELSCGNGKCVPKEMFCDGKTDCPNGVDEPVTCNCGEYLKLTEPKLFCDGRRHCLDKSDERYQQCMCKDSSFKCEKSIYNNTTACIPQDFVCDGEPDCPQGEDESEKVCWTLKPNRRDPRGKGEVMRKSFGVFHSECFSRPVELQREVTNMCIKLGYKSGILVDGSRPSESQFVPRNDFYMFQLNNDTWITMRNDVSYGVWKIPESSCYRLFVQCF